MVTQMGKNTDNYKMLGLMLANGLVALAGSIYCQYGSVYNSDMGTGTVVIALAVLLTNLLLDLAYGLADPRVRYGRG